MGDSLKNIKLILECLLENLDEGIQIVNSKGKTIYYNKSMGRIEGIQPETVLHKRVNEYLKDVKEDSSTLVQVLKNGEKITNLVQSYISEHKKKVITINTTVPVKYDDFIIAAIEISRDFTQLKKLTEYICRLQDMDRKTKKHYSFNDIYYKSSVMKNVVEKAERASRSSSSVLIYAETGCGKEVVAQSIHYDGLRRNGPFIPVNCAAIPDLLLEGILFGTERGSFTGAETKKGLFEQANHGTILLDEVNSMKPYLQSKLLRVIQEGYVRPVGSSKTVNIDVRIIATINENPEKLISEGKLRSDFYYRLSVIEINIPPLRERKKDIELFVKHFIEHYNNILGKNIQGIDDNVMQSFLEYDWPGNVRQLKNVIESAINMADNNTILNYSHFDTKIFCGPSNICNDLNSFGNEKIDLPLYVDNIERKIIKSILAKNNFNISKTSKQLNLSRQDLQYKIKKYKIG